MIRNTLLGLVVLMLLGVGFSMAAVPSLRDKAASVPQRFETWWHEQQPHDLLVPAPAVDGVPADSAALVPTASQSTEFVPTTAPARTPAAADKTALAPTPQPKPTVTVAPRRPFPATPDALKLTGFRHEYQGWNNCGPSTLAMLLSHYGGTSTQKEIAPVLKPNTNDKNVGPDELADFLQQQGGLEAKYRINGDLDTVKRLIANNMPVIVETWFEPKPNDGMGHYRLLFGYSDKERKFYALDSYDGPNVSMDYDQFDSLWRVFGRTYVTAWPKDKTDLAAAVLGDDFDDKLMWQQAQARAEGETRSNANDPYAWFNLGSALQLQGKSGEAVQAFDRARRIGLPWRMLWYQFEQFDAYLAAGRNQDVLDLVAANLKQAPDLEESLYYRGRALQALGKKNEAATAYRDAIKLRPGYQAAAKALQSVVAMQ
jgi:tetratricopeptide (TPR) repeat protein